MSKGQEGMAYVLGGKIISGQPRRRRSLAGIERMRGEWEGVAEYVPIGNNNKQCNAHAHNIGKVEKKRLMRLYKS